MQYQDGIFAGEIISPELQDAEIEYLARFLAPDEAALMYQQLLEETDWQQDTIQVYGKQHLTPRLTSWVGEPWMRYRYSHHTMQPTAWSDCLIALRQRVEQATSEQFNSVLLNYYRDGRDSNGWHSDDEPELGPAPVIASLSLGATRDFLLRHKNKSGLKHKIALQPGSLLVMKGRTQQFWQHQIPKRASSAGRINLTFRTIIQPSKI